MSKGGSAYYSISPERISSPCRRGEGLERIESVCADREKMCWGETVTLQSCLASLGLVADIADGNSSLLAGHGMEQAISKTGYRIIR
jgi:hypothetical protein